MPAHPFNHAYIGLGLLDDASIGHHGDNWAAEYRDTRGDPYLVVYVGQSRVRIEEFDAGQRVALTVDSTLRGAIGRHGQEALGDDVSRFWARIARTSSQVWMQLTPPEALAAYVPAIGFGRVSIPVPLDGTWRDPEPGPLARRLGFRPFVEDAREAPAMYRYVEGETRPRTKASCCGKRHCRALSSRRRSPPITWPMADCSIEWRPFMIPEPADRIGRAWKATIPALTPDGGIQSGYAIVEDEMATAAPKSATVKGR